MTILHPDFAPFKVAPCSQHGDAPRAISSLEGIGDRLRAAAFAELQAEAAFTWAANTLTDAPPLLIETWKELAHAERRHRNWLMNRLVELGIDPAEKQVSDLLWHSLVACTTAQGFAHYMASAEERGRKAGERFYLAMREVDLKSAEIFKKIADEEVAHIETAFRFYPLPQGQNLAPRTPKPLSPPGRLI